MARQLDEDKQAKTVCGSPLFMAPEVLFQQPYDHAADSWSLGVIFYNMVVGGYPFKASDMSELMEELKEGFYCIPGKVKLSK
jgi:serine/threonine-protein kinase ULK/ATG1